MTEKERLKIKQRQAERIAIVKSKGIKLGRPKIEYPYNWNEVYKLWKNKEITVVKAMELLQLKRNSFYKLVNEYERKDNEVKVKSIEDMSIKELEKLS